MNIPTSLRGNAMAAWRRLGPLVLAFAASGAASSPAQASPAAQAAISAGQLQAPGAAALGAGKVIEARLFLAASQGDGGLPSAAQGGQSAQSQRQPELAVQPQADTPAASAEQRVEGALSALPGGGYLAARREANAVLVQRYGVEGRPASAPARIALGAVPGGQLSSITALAPGGYALTWLGLSPNPFARWDADYPLIVQRYAATGTLLDTEQAAVTQPFSRRFPPPALPQLLALAGGGYVLTWAQYADGGFNLYTRRYAGDGAPAGLAQLVGPAVGPVSVAAAANGGHIVAWGYTAISARAFGPDGMASGPVQAVGARSTAAGFPADQRTGLAALAGGGAVVTWANQTFGSYIYARRLAANGAPVGEAFIVDGSSMQRPGLEPQMASSAAALPDGGYVVAWLAPGGAIHGRRFNAAGAPLGSASRLNTQASSAFGPSVVASASGGFAVTWQVVGADGATLGYARFFDARGLVGSAS